MKQEHILIMSLLVLVLLLSACQAETTENSISKQGQKTSYVEIVFEPKEIINCPDGYAKEKFLMNQTL